MYYNYSVMKNYSQLKKELLKNKKIRSVYDDLGKKHALAQDLIDTCSNRGTYAKIVSEN